MPIHRDLTDAQWHSVEGLFHAWRARKDPRGRPAHPPRTVLNGVLWIMATRAAWASLPHSYPDYRTCHRHFKAWHGSGVLRNALHTLFADAGIAMHDAMMQRMQSRHAQVPPVDGAVAASPSGPDETAASEQERALAPACTQETDDCDLPGYARRA